MSDEVKKPGQGKKPEKRKQLSSALRENLKRRKEAPRPEREEFVNAMGKVKK